MTEYKPRYTTLADCIVYPYIFTGFLKPVKIKKIKPVFKHTTPHKHETIGGREMPKYTGTPPVIGRELFDTPNVFVKYDHVWPDNDTSEPVQILTDLCCQYDNTDQQWQGLQNDKKRIHDMLATCSQDDLQTLKYQIDALEWLNLTGEMLDDLGRIGSLSFKMETHPTQYFDDDMGLYIPDEDTITPEHDIIMSYDAGIDIPDKLNDAIRHSFANYPKKNRFKIHAKLRLLTRQWLNAAHYAAAIGEPEPNIPQELLEL